MTNPSAARSSLLAPARDPDPRALAALSLAELAPLARERMAPAAWDYVASGAWDEISLAESESAWRAARLRPRVLVDVARVDTSATLLGAPASVPWAIAPMAVQALAHPDAELAVARAASAAGVPLILATLSSASLEDVAAAAPDATRLFQLYDQHDRGVARSLVERAAAAGYRGLVVTVDLPVLGHREADRRNAFTLDFPLGNLPEGRPGAEEAIVEGALARLDGIGGDSTLTWTDIEMVAGWSSMPLMLKGILAPEDARRAVEIGAAGIVVSNHGGRQLDRAIAPLHALPAIVEAVDGRAEVWVDGGVRRGIDLAIARALGAQGVLVGRPVYWGLAAAGEAGVAKVCALLADELRRAMALLGAPTLADLRPEMVVLPPAWANAIG
jgi:4-hydroxymandelate oxidase